MVETNKHPLLAELRELKGIQRGLPKNEYRKKIDKRIKELLCRISAMEKENKTIISDILFNGKPRGNQIKKITK